MAYRATQPCPSCGKLISPLSRNSGIDRVCPFCWHVVRDADTEVADMRREPKHTTDDNGLVAELETAAGLCSTCKHYSSCTFPKCSDSPKLFCEEFECAGASCSGVEIGIAPAKSPEVLTGLSAEQFLGLCVNCEIRESCSHAKLTGGVWFCEEYR